MMYGILLLWAAGFLVLPSVHLAIPAILSIAGICLARKAALQSPITDPALKTSWCALLVGFAAYAVTGLLLNVYHGDTDPGAYERLLPFLILPALGWTIRAVGRSADAFIAALGLGGFLAGASAIQDLILSPDLRAEGATGNAIKFGNGAVLVACCCLLAAQLFPFRRNAIVWRLALLAAAAAAVLASFLSGSKGGWIALIFLALVAAYNLGRNRNLLQRSAVAVGALAVFVIAGLLAPASLVRDRIKEGIDGAAIWFNTDGAVTEGSVSLRFKLWELGYTIFTENPLAGAGVIGKSERWNELVSVDPARDFIGTNTSAHNDFIEVLSEGGVIGATGLALSYLGVWLAFWRWRHHHDPAVLALARMGLMLVPLYLAFGMTVSVAGINFFRSLFLGFSVALLAFITVQLSKSKAD